MSEKQTKHHTLLIADDDESLRRVLEFHLTTAGFKVIVAANGAEALDIFLVTTIDCVVTDLRMPELSGLDLLARLKAINAETPVIVITAFGEIETAVAAMRAGAFDYITKPFSRDEILLTIDKAIEYNRAVVENRYLKRLVGERFRLENVIGDSPKIRRVFDVVERVAKTDATVLINGESGTGKELIAKGIHFSGARASRPFIAVNCGAIPEGLIESELFGHRKGSFTGAFADAKGKFEEAEGGTLFLDEISQMPLALQTVLLRVLQESEIVRIGESRSRKIDVRIIAATNQNLETMIKDGDFREDLYFRLAVVPVDLPPLRQRREDIPLLVEHFFNRARSKHGFDKLVIEREVFGAFSAYSFPGNVRELENLIERMVILSDGDKLTFADVPKHLQQTSAGVGNIALELPPEGVSLEEIEREIIRRALEIHDGNQSQTANYLKITRSALIYRMQKYELTT